MASKRKSYRGTPAEHREDAMKYGALMRKQASKFRRARDVEDCKGMLAALSDMRYYQGGYDISAIGARKYGTSGSSNTARSLEDQFKRVCLVGLRAK